MCFDICKRGPLHRVIREQPIQQVNKILREEVLSPASAIALPELLVLVVDDELEEVIHFLRRLERRLTSKHLK